MSATIIAEDFELTDSIRFAVNEKIEKIQSHMRKPTEFRVFLSKNSAAEYMVKIECHYHKKDLIGTARGQDFYKTLSKSKQAVLRQVDDSHAKIVTSRHKGHAERARKGVAVQARFFFIEFLFFFFRVCIFSFMYILYFLCFVFVFVYTND